MASLQQIKPQQKRMGLPFILYRTAETLPVEKPVLSPACLVGTLPAERRNEIVRLLLSPSSRPLFDRGRLFFFGWMKRRSRAIAAIREAKQQRFMGRAPG